MAPSSNKARSQNAKPSNARQAWRMWLGVAVFCLGGAAVVAATRRSEPAAGVRTVSLDRAEPASASWLSERATPSEGPARQPKAWRVEVLQRYPHARDAFTQGLLWHAGRIYESTGLEGRSSLRRVRLDSGAVEELRPLPPHIFAEGLALAQDELIQLSWQNGVAFVWRQGNLAPLREHRYSGEGWGLCHDGKRLVMSDGSDMLTFRDPTSFEARGTLAVRRAGLPQRELNELECVGTSVYANVWRTDEIVRIDATTGVVDAVIDASGLLTPVERQHTDVLNGIAYVSERKTFLITGKLWPYLFEVRFVPR